jgi:hypothetical protein
VGEERLDLGEELGVVVDVLDPLGVDAGLVGELVDRAVLARVDVQRPLRDRQLVARGARGNGLGVAGGARVLDPVVAAGGDAGGQADEGDEERDEACQFLELDSKNLSPLARSGRKT